MWRKLALGLLVTAALLALVELSLRAVGFRHRTTMAYLQFGYPSPTAMVELFDPDPELWWRLRPGVEGVSRSGFKGAPFEAAKPPGRFRIVVMGDSCIFGVGTPNSLPLEIERELRDRTPQVEVINAGVPSYTSFQGTRLLDRVLSWQPDLVLVSYVWNDHWLSQGYRDSEQRPQPIATQTLIRTLEKVRLFQLLEWLVARGRRAPDRPREPRVSPEEYAANLRAMELKAHAAHVPIAFLSAPSNHQVGHVPEYLLRQHFVEHADDAVTVHREYNALVAQVARESGASFVDVEKLLPADGRDPVFWKDGIHFTEDGHRVIARLIVAELSRLNLVPAPRGS